MKYNILSKTLRSESLINETEQQRSFVNGRISSLRVTAAHSTVRASLPPLDFSCREEGN